jgi:heat shock protein HtpX
MRILLFLATNAAILVVISIVFQSIAAQIFLSILASMIVMWFSRRREFRADAGGSELAGRDKMIAALRRLQQASGEQESLPDQLAAFGIAGESAMASSDCS